ncbi:MAG: carbohydrate-binding domain-containing protein [Pirellulales bacterium]
MLSAVPGDFNVDGVVDSADYSVWRDKLGSVYTADDYGTWRNNFGTASIALEGTSIDVGKSGATASGSVLTISHAGTYWISGTLTDGRIIVDTADAGTVKLIFDGVNITSSNNAPVYVANAEDVVITLATGTQNYLSDGSTYNNGTETEPDAALFSKSDLTINGTGSLSVDANYADGIASKDDLKIESGTITVDAVDDGIRGTDSVVIDGGEITVTSGGDGIKSTKGYVTVAGGTINLTAVTDGVQAETTLSVSGGSIAATASGRGLTTSGDIAISGGTIGVTNSGPAGRGLDADGNVTFSGGSTTVSLSGATVLTASGSGYDPSYPTGVKANGSISVSNTASVSVTGTSAATGARGLSADNAITVTGGTINVTLAGNGATYTNISGVIDSYSAAALSADSAISITGGTITTISSGTGGKGLKSDGTITIGSATRSPTLNITTTGARFLQSGTDYNHPKTIVAAGAINIVSGTTTLNSTDDGIHSDTSITISGGTNVVNAISATQGVGEGVEAPIINFTGGVTSIVASNDGINATYGTVSGGTESNDGSQLNISGGIVIVAGSDAIDSNGNITITGGITIVDGPATGVEEGIDYNGTFLINGGTLISGGSNSNMTKAASTSSTQVNFLLKSSTALASSSLLHIQDSAGNEVLTYKPKYNAYYFHVSTSTLAKNTSYSVYFGGTYSGGSYVGGLTTWGLLTGGTWSSTGATLKKTFTTSASSTVNTVTM